MKDIAIKKALDASISNRKMVIGTSETHVCISFNETEGNQNSLVALRRGDALALLQLLETAFQGGPVAKICQNTFNKDN